MMDTTLEPTLTSIDDLHSLGPNWNSYDALAPDPAAIAHAKEWITKLHQCVQEWKLPWFAPRVCADPSDGGVALAWDDYNHHELTFYIGAQGQADIVQVTTDASHHMKDYVDQTREQADTCKDIWAWLCQGNNEQES